ncbi:MAG: hypothetical protein ACTHJN_17175, partial [Ginsengibacter sp.]
MKRKPISVRNSVLLLLFVCPFPLYAQVIQMTAHNSSVNYERLAKIDGLINDYIKNDWVKGVAT